MGITGAQAQPMLDFDHIAVAAVAAREADRTTGGGQHRCPRRPREVHAGMEGIATAERVDPGAKPTSPVDSQAHRFGGRKARKSVVQGRNFAQLRLRFHVSAAKLAI